ncbi:MAG: FAD-dependent monooxygenase [Alphaproteobacteria bacterium]
MSERVDCLVVGTGPVGMVAASALAQKGLTVGLAGPEAVPERDGRTVAILDSGVKLLESFGLWGDARDLSAPLIEMRIIDDTGSLFRAPPVTFRASELGLDAFGQNIELTDLVAQLARVLKIQTNLKQWPEAVTGFKRRSDGFIEAELTSGAIIECGMLIGADGRNSKVREFAGIHSKDWHYPQSALTAIFSHDRDHDDRSTEFHTRSGPFTLVPLKGKRSSLVWMMAPKEAERLAKRSNEDFARVVEKQAHSILGKMKLETKIGIVPMSGLSTDHYAKDQIAVIGEAAHVFPPIGAQGLNLGLRDIDSLLKSINKDRDQNALQRFDSDRRRDVKTRTMAVDLLNRSLLADYVPIDFARGAGLMAIASLKPLRQFVMRRGAGF